MKVAYSWIKEFVDIDLPAKEIAEKLNISGIETISYKFGKYIPNIITVKILSVEKHPERDKLFICKATDGEREYQVITGADNVKKDAVVILAKIGAVIGDKEIKKVKFGSFESEGMFLSLEELGIEESSEGIFLLDEDTPIGVDANKILTLGEDDIFEIEITPNRGDALSVKGLAREISAIFNLPFKDKKVDINCLSSDIDIELLTDKTYRYRAVLIKNILVKQSPLDIRLKLIKSGASVINNIVDITNYILLQEGQPLHAFDFDKINGAIYIRQAKDGEKVLCLDGIERELSKDDIVIADKEKILAIAGVIGADNSKITENSKNILLEAANFDRFFVRKTAKRLSISTDSSYRFERGVDIQALENAQNKAVNMILDLAGGEVIAAKDIYHRPYIPKKVVVRPEFIQKILGEKIEEDEIVSILNRLQINAEKENNKINVYIPSFRSYDLEREIDIVEEIARIKGYDSFLPSMPHIPLDNFSLSEDYKFFKKTREFFKDNGFNEVVNYTFVSEEIYNILGLNKPNIEISNYLLKTQSIMRDNLAVSLINTLQENLRHNIKDLSIFEISSAFFENHEEIRVGLLAVGEYVKGFNFTKGKYHFSTTKKWGFLSFKGIIESYLKSIGFKNIDFIPADIPFLHKYQSAKIILNNQEVGYFGKIDPEKSDILEIPKDTFIAELKLFYVPRNINEEKLKDGYLFTAYKNKEPVIFKELPKYPAVYRDLAFIVEEDLELDKLIKALRSYELIEEVRVFDIYYIDENNKSVAFNLSFRAKDRSLSDEDINSYVGKIVEDFKERFNAKLREG